MVPASENAVYKASIESKVSDGRYFSIELITSSPLSVNSLGAISLST